MSETFDHGTERDYQPGDWLHLVEWDLGKGKPGERARETGRECFVSVTHVLEGGSFGISPDHVVMSVRREGA